MSEHGRLAAISRGLTLLVSNAIKLGGLYIAIHEILTQHQPRVSEMGIALFMMQGAQFSERALMDLVSRAFGTHSPPPPHEQPPRAGRRR